MRARQKIKACLRLVFWKKSFCILSTIPSNINSESFAKIIYGKGKRKVHLNFCQHLFLKLSELTFISNQEISINPFLSEK